MPTPTHARRRHATFRFALMGALLLTGTVAAPSSGCVGGGQKAQLQDRKNSLADELRALVPAVLAAKKKARPILAKRRLGNTAMSIRGGTIAGARYTWASTHAGVKVRGLVQIGDVDATSAPAKISVTKSGGKRQGKR